MEENQMKTNMEIIDNFVDNIMKKLGEEEIDLTYYQYMLSQLQNKIEFYLKYQS